MGWRRKKNSMSSQPISKLPWRPGPVPVHSPTSTPLCSRSELAAGRRPPPAHLRAPCLAGYSPSTPPAWIRASACPSPHAAWPVHRGQPPSPQTSPARRPPVTLSSTTAASSPTDPRPNTAHTWTALF